MAASVDEAAELVSRGRRVFDDDVLMRRAGEAILTRLGEAARRVPGTFRDAHPDLPWQQMIGMRNRTAHEYDSLDYDVVWSTLEVSLPDLGERLAGLPDVDVTVGPAAAGPVARSSMAVPECGFLMPRVKKLCVRRSGHRGDHDWRRRR